jgi:glycosyltransferase involved in cell wall biosynthesis
MLLSIIIPTLNEEKTIGDHLREIKATLKIPYELIVSDGKSTDNTVAIAKQYADQVVVHSGPERQSIAGGRNAGAAAATGEVLFHTDADVRVPDMNNFFATVLKAFEDPKVVAATTRLRIYPEEERYNDWIAHTIFNTAMHTTNALHIHLGAYMAKGECQFARTSAFRTVGGYDEKVIVGEDGNLFYRLGEIGTIKYFNNLVVYHSPRRFRKVGYLRMLGTIGKESYSLLFHGKSHLKEWTPVR